MKRSILDQDIQTFINKNIEKPISETALAGPLFGSDWHEVLIQIESKLKSKSKLPTWFSSPGVYFPSKIAIEQTSSEKTAAYKATLVSGESLIDLSGGFGVDSYYFSKKISRVVHCEQDEMLGQIVLHNSHILKSNNIKFYNSDSYNVLKNLNQHFDWIYVDPSRRNDIKGKVFLMEDCLPNVPKNLDFYFNYTNNILIKTAPLLDLSAGIKVLQNVKSIHIIAVENEVKEILWQLEKEYCKEINIRTVNIEKTKNTVFNFIYSKYNSNKEYKLPQKFLFEPNAAIMKSGGFDQVMLQFDVFKLQKHTHLYTSNQALDFPGRVFEIELVLDYNKINMKQFLENKTANITTRNFTETVSSIRKKWKIGEGGSQYCFFATDANNKKIVLICKKKSNDENQIL